MITRFDRLLECGADAVRYRLVVPGAAWRRKLGSGVIRLGQQYGGVVVYPGGSRVFGEKGLFLRKPYWVRVAKRGRVRGMSRWSAERLGDRLMSLDLSGFVGEKFAKEGRGLWVGMTYPREYPEVWREIKRHKEVWRKRLGRSEFGDYLYVMWKMEYQRRAAPHFHFVMLWDRLVSVGEFWEWGRRAWYEVVGSGDLRHVVRGFDVVALWGGGPRMVCYLKKEMGKAWTAGPGSGETGRVWGEWRRGGAPVARGVFVRVLTRKGLEGFIRRMKEKRPRSPFLQSVDADKVGWRLYGESAEIMGMLEGLDDVEVVGEV